MGKNGGTVVTGSQNIRKKHVFVKACKTRSCPETKPPLQLCTGPECQNLRWSTAQIEACGWVCRCKTVRCIDARHKKHVAIHAEFRGYCKDRSKRQAGLKELHDAY